MVRSPTAALFGSSVLLALIAGPASALSPLEVWSAWQKTAESAGHPLSAQMALPQGQDLRLERLATTLSLGRREVSFVLPELVLHGEADGTVTVAIPPELHVDVSIGTRHADLVLHQNGLTVRAGGSPDSLTHAIAAETLELKLEAAANGEGDIPILLAANLAGFTADHHAAEAEMADIAATAAAFDLLIEAGDASHGVKASLVMQDAELDMRAIDFLDIDPWNIARRVTGGSSLALDIRSGTAGLEADLRRDATSEPDHLRATGQGATARFAVGPDGFDTRMDIVGAEVSFLSPVLPDFSGTIASAGAGLTLPVLPAKGAMPASLRFELGAVAPAAETWDAMDPAGGLPHDPLSVEVTLEGLLNPRRNLLGTDAGLADAWPDSLDIRRFAISGLGASIGASGAFHFHLEDRESWNGLPRPEGTMDMTFRGIDAVLLGMKGSGLLPDSQAGAARMILGMFASPGQEPGSYTTRVEATPDGKLLANGQRLR
ncbi:DUF2125 domain-containing protein [Cereibacter sphaeroides]|uniref:DUF2125 domain-containing protein n=1 Tax=Cereibacter sphaeroides TaxID=1063 RepID=UPI001F2BC5A2|nr:DUF2125 domain-containing protein [Cereibacter sphaeroides]MCE6959720.1 DUF2125 domain-containing protein [Cereibacter sphaeroides]MCE6974419.1 DUF2125 domain-containing protein [Cereibacter sphaeroides]